MTVANTCRTMTAVAGADLSAAVGKFVVFNSSGQAVLASTASGPVDGVVVVGAISGRECVIALPDGGICQIWASAAISAAALIATTNAGLAATFSAAAAAVAVGRALEAATAAGQLIRCQFAVKTAGAAT